MRIWIVLASFLVTCGASHSAFAQHARPTPHELLDQAMQPFRQALDDAHANDAERDLATDVRSRAEALAAAIVEARQRGESDRVHEYTERMELLGRIARGRIEAARAQSRAAAAERAAMAADARRVQARAALERAAEGRLESQRGPTGSESPSSSAAPGGSP